MIYSHLSYSHIWPGTNENLASEIAPVRSYIRPVYVASIRETTVFDAMEWYDYILRRVGTFADATEISHVTLKLRRRDIVEVGVFWDVCPYLLKTTRDIVNNVPRAGIIEYLTVKCWHDFAWLVLSRTIFP